EEPIFINADKERMTQVLRNLFVNAINNSSNLSFLAVQISRTELSHSNNPSQEAIHFILHDKGEGIKEAEVATILSPSMSEKQASHQWLGLRVCYEVIKAHHGRIWAFNNKDGGATFNFIIPISAYSTENRNSASLLNEPAHDKPNILIIDDEEICLSAMELLLNKTNYNLIKCNSGNMGLKYLKKHPNDISLILLDLMMPDIYGLNLLADIKNDPELAKIPVILQTASLDEEEIIKAFNLGIVCFIRKPYQKKHVIPEINKALRLYDLNNMLDKPVAKAS
ncbi:MAG: hybrid sensor histidine kinase/response regulator, partial [Pseudomonadota bacterium]